MKLVFIVMSLAFSASHETMLAPLRVLLDDAAQRDVCSLVGLPSEFGESVLPMQAKLVVNGSSGFPGAPETTAFKPCAGFIVSPEKPIGFSSAPEHRVQQRPYGLHPCVGFMAGPYTGNCTINVFSLMSVIKKSIYGTPYERMIDHCYETDKEYRKSVDDRLFLLTHDLITACATWSPSMMHNVERLLVLLSRRYQFEGKLRSAVLCLFDEIAIYVSDSQGKLRADVILAGEYSSEIKAIIGSFLQDRTVFKIVGKMPLFAKVIEPFLVKINNDDGAWDKVERWVTKKVCGWTHRRTKIINNIYNQDLAAFVEYCRTWNCARAYEIILCYPEDKLFMTLYKEFLAKLQQEMLRKFGEDSLANLSFKVGMREAIELDAVLASLQRGTSAFFLKS